MRLYKTDATLVDSPVKNSSADQRAMDGKDPLLVNSPVNNISVDQRAIVQERCHTCRLSCQE